ncbi:hypothetical protein VB735_29260 [Halotia wernerae UHCC 0503]|nr:hypothetical protein [Halotia wernerae UHCC 0503]
MKQGTGDRGQERSAVFSLGEARVRERLGFPPQLPQCGGTFWEEVSPQKLPWEPARGAALQVEQLLLLGDATRTGEQV